MLVLGMTCLIPVRHEQEIYSSLKQVKCVSPPPSCDLSLTHTELHLGTQERQKFMALKTKTVKSLPGSHHKTERARRRECPLWFLMGSESRGRPWGRPRNPESVTKQKTAALRSSLAQCQENFPFTIHGVQPLALGLWLRSRGWTLKLNMDRQSGSKHTV